MYEITTLDRSRVDQAFRRRIEGDEKILDLPRKAIERGKIREYDQLKDSVFGANEFYKEVNTVLLRDARDDDFALHIDGLDQQIWKSEEEEFDFTFLNYTDRHRITRVEAYQMVGILNNTSDYLISPMQSELYHAIESDTGLDDWAYQSIYDGTELFLQGCIDQHPEKPIMGWIPQLDITFLEDFINLYEKYDVEAFAIDFHWQLPTQWDKVARLRYLMRRVANQRIHEDVLFYGINMRPGTYDSDLGYIPAADVAAIRMMIDIIGGNHTGPRIPPDVDVGEREGFRIYDTEVSAYRNVDLSDLRDHWPEESALDVDEVMNRSEDSKRHRNRYETLVNSETIEMELGRLRWCLDEGLEDRFFEVREDADEILRAGSAVRRGFDDGLEAPIGEYT